MYLYKAFQQDSSDQNLLNYYRNMIVWQLLDRFSAGGQEPDRQNLRIVQHPDGVLPTPTFGPGLQQDSRGRLRGDGLGLGSKPG